jgi:DNA-binding transcriptional ArsR family regulator
MTNQQADLVAELFSVLANPYRVRMLHALAGGREMRLKEMDLPGRTAITAAKPLLLLGLVARRKSGQEAYYRLTVRGIARLLAVGVDVTGAALRAPQVNPVGHDFPNAKKERRRRTPPPPSA